MTKQYLFSYLLIPISVPASIYFLIWLYEMPFKDIYGIIALICWMLLYYGVIVNPLIETFYENDFDVDEFEEEEEN